MQLSDIPNGSTNLMPAESNPQAFGARVRAREEVQHDMQDRVTPAVFLVEQKSEPVDGVPVMNGGGGPVLKPSSQSEPIQFDSKCVANPVVLPPSVTNTTKWQMYYYGNPGTWAGGIKGFLPTGWTGLAESEDGIHWTKVRGNEEGGSILAPTGNPKDWDGVHLGVGDVIRINENELHMYYFGGSGETISKGPLWLKAASTLRLINGMRMSIGRARSVDGGRTWERMGMVLEGIEEEGLFASWPRIMRPAPSETGKPWKMLYHAFNGQRWAAFGATSWDQGETWKRDGMLLGPGDNDSWDSTGVGTRAVARTSSGDWLMVYEAVGGGKGLFSQFTGAHRFGLARLADVSGIGSGKWEKDTALTGVPGGPILEPGVAPLEPWTSLVIGTPYLVPMEDGSLRLYFCSRKDFDMGMSIGLVVSDSGGVSPSSWRSVSQ